MAHRRSFYLYKRHKKNGDYWYVCFLDRETGKQLNAKSIDCLKEKLGLMDFQRTTRKEDAAVIAQKALDSGLVFSDDSNRLFVEWCTEFWTWDKSEYIALRKRLKENSIGKEYAYNMLKNCIKNVEPLVPKGLRIVNVTTSILDRITKALYASGKSPGTVKIIIYSFSIPLKEAARLGIISRNPADKLLSSSHSDEERGVLTKEEMVKIVKLLRDEEDSIFPSYRLGILLAVSTGMRLSEVRAVNVSDIEESEVKGYEKLNIRHSIGHLSGVKSTKGKYERSVLIASSLSSELKENADSSGIALPSPRGGYMSPPVLRTAFYEVLEKIGIGEEERDKRNLTFHSLRHTFSTLSRDWNISQEDRMLVLGHKSAEVNDRYTHASDVALERVSVLSQAILECKL